MRRPRSGYWVSFCGKQALHSGEGIFAGGQLPILRKGRGTRPPGPRTALLVRCSAEEAQLIREEARRRMMTVSGYMLLVIGRTLRASIPHKYVLPEAAFNPLGEPPRRRQED